MLATRGQMGNQASGPATPAGFTLIELMVVVTILAILVRVVVLNAGAMIPGMQIEGDAKKLAAMLKFVRTEAMLQGKAYRLELDLNQSRYRMVLPPEDTLVTRRDESLEAQTLMWHDLDKNVQLVGVSIASAPAIRGDSLYITFDATGQSADFAVFLKHRHDEDSFFSIHVAGLSGAMRLLPGKGEIDQETVTEYSF
jgi:type II secretion system protein H